MGSRRSIRPPDLTSLFDVLFLFVFVSLVNAGISRRAVDDALAKAATPPAPTPPVRMDLVGLRDRAVGLLASRTEVVARVSRDGSLVKLALADRTIAIGAPLVERVADPDIGVAYLGERNADLHVCRVIARALGAADLRDDLVIIAPDAALAELTVALASGLRRDADRCLIEDRGVAVILDPAAMPPPPPKKGPP